MSDNNHKHKQAKRKSIRSSAGIWLCSTSLFALAGAMTPGVVHAQAWTGATSQDWLTANNWNPNFLPVNLADIAISTAKYPIIDGVAVSVGTVKVGAFPLVPGAKAQLDIVNGGKLSSSTGVIAELDKQVGVVSVSGPGSLWNNTGAMAVGKGGAGDLLVSGGGQVKSNSITVAELVGTGSTLSVDGAGSKVTSAGQLMIGMQSAANMYVKNGGTVSNGYAEIAQGAGTHGYAGITGKDSRWDSSGGLIVGNAGIATLEVSDAGQISSLYSVIAAGVGSYTIATVSGSGSRWDTTQFVKVGVRGTAYLNIEQGAVVTSAGGHLGWEGSSLGKVDIHDAGSRWDNTGALTVGLSAWGLLYVHDGAAITSLDGTIAADLGSTGRVDVTKGASWTMTDGMTVAQSGKGRLFVTSGGQVSNKTAVIALKAGAKGEVTVQDAGSLWTSSAALTVAAVGEGSLQVLDGGQVRSLRGAVASDVGGLGHVVVSGAGSRWDNTQTLTVGVSGMGEMAILQGAAVTNTGGRIGDGAGSNSLVSVEGAGSTWKNTGALLVGVMGQGTLRVAEGGLVESAGATIGFAAGSKGRVEIMADVYAGTPAKWINAGDLVVGNLGEGTLALRTSSQLTVTGGDIVIAQQTGSTGKLIIGTEFGESYAGQVTAPRIRFGSGAGALVFNHESADYVFATTIQGKGVIAHQLGSTIYTGNGSAFTGTTTVSGGTLRVNGTLGGTVDVQSGGTLGGTGFLGGAVTVAASGTLLGSSGQTLTMGSLALTAGSNINVALGAPGNVTGLFKVGGNLTLAGMLNVADAGGFGQGVYRIFDYSGALTDNGMTVGTLPIGTGTIQTAMANQVNLVVDSGGPVPAVQFWNGTTTVADGTIHGGSGTWSAGPATNWTDVNGTVASAWAGTFAVFQNNPGNITVDASAGMVSTTGMQFIGTGWTVAGDPITLNGAGGNTALRVGDGTLGGAAYRATIGSELTGNSRLVKDDLGTLILTGANSHTGGTTIAAGTLQIGNGSMAGSIAGDVLNNGTLAFNRSNDLTVAGAITGSGTLRQIGSGTTMLTGDSSGFTGTTQVETGALSVNGKLGGTLTVLAGGQLQGVGIVGDVSVFGTIAPGNSIGTMTVGNITFQPGSIYQVEVNANGQSDRIVATGTATLNGGSVQVLAGQGNYLPSTTYTILTAAGGRTGTFTGVTSNLAFLAPSLSYDPDNVYLTLTRNTVSFPSVGGTFNQRQAGAGVESLGQGNPIWNAVVQMDAPTAQAAFNQLSGEVHASAKTALYEDSRLVRDGALSRLRQAFGGNVVAPSTAQVASVDDACSGETCQADPTTGIAAWAQGFGSWGYTSSDGNAAGLSRSTGGVLVGVDAAVFEVARLGLFGGYSHTNFNVADRQSSGGSDNVHLGAYGGAQWGPIGIRAGLAYTWHNLSTSRSVAFPGFADSLRATYGAGTFQVFGEAGYRVEVGQAAFEPFANIAYMSLSTKGFSETGGAAALTSTGLTNNVTATTLGLRAGSAFVIAGLAGQARGTVGWQHAFTDTTPWANLQLAGGTPFTVNGVPIAKDAALLELGVDLRLSERASVGLGYTGQFASGAQDQSVRAAFNYKF